MSDMSELKQTQGDPCVDDQHRGTECKCCHMLAHCCSHHCCCFYFCKNCRHADHQHKDGLACEFGGACTCKKYVGRTRGLIA